jgi:hypothetical protein
MANIRLDVNDPDQVDNPRIIEVDVADQSGQKMIILSGIARPEWRITDDDHLYGETVVINLRKSVLAVIHATVSVGLASIGNNDTKFQFAVDSTDLQTDPVTQELTLTAQLGLRGDWSTLNRFGYQVVALVTTQSTGISGTIRWSKDLFDPTHLPPDELASLFLVAANTVYIPPSSGGFGSYPVYTPVAYGATGGVQHDNVDYIVPYKIPGGPYNQALTVLVKVSSQFRSGYPPVVSQVAGPNPVTLTTADPAVTGVDFRVMAAAAIK